jgi:hypothetical protein
MLSIATSASSERAWFHEKVQSQISRAVQRPRLGCVGAESVSQSGVNQVVAECARWPSYLVGASTSANTVSPTPTVPDSTVTV